MRQHVSQVAVWVYQGIRVLKKNPFPIPFPCNSVDYSRYFRHSEPMSEEEGNGVYLAPDILDVSYLETGAVAAAEGTGAV